MGLGSSPVVGWSSGEVLGAAAVLWQCSGGAKDEVGCCGGGAAPFMVMHGKDRAVGTMRTKQGTVWSMKGKVALYAR